MPSTCLHKVLLLAAVLVLYVCAHHDDDFGFELSDDIEVVIDGEARTSWRSEHKAIVGKVFHMRVVPREAFEGNVQGFEAKRKEGRGLPLWLLFDKKTGVFWGIPLQENIGNIYLKVRSLAGKNDTEEVIINVVESESNEDNPVMEQCPRNEDNTILTLVLDKDVRAIKPRQRVVAVNNIAKFFGLPYSAFTLKPQLEKDDITDSSVILAGPGNLHSRTSKVNSLLQVPVGCDGRLWVSMVPLVHQLKQQARDGTIAEVLRLPLIGWRIKTETRSVARLKRQIGDPSSYDKIESSGDYGDDDYYDEDYDYEEEDLGDIEKNPPPTKQPVTHEIKTATSTTTETTINTVPTTLTSTKISESHHHRHHHGEVINVGDVDPNISVIQDHHIKTTPKVPVTKEMSDIFTTTSTTTTTTAAVMTPKSTEPSITTLASTDIPRSIDPTTKKFLVKPNQALSTEDDDYDYTVYDDEDDFAEDPLESATIIPDLARKHTIPAVIDDHETTSEASTLKTTIKEVTSLDTVIPSTVSTTGTSTAPTSTTITTTSTTTTTTELTPTTFEIIEETEPAIFYTTETTTASPSTVVTAAVTETIPSAAPPTTTYITTSTAAIVTAAKVTEPPTTQQDTTTVKLTTARHVTTPTSTTAVREVTENTDIVIKKGNFKPYIENRLQPMSVTAGKVFRYVIPKNTFKDSEDGYNITLQFLNPEEQPITKNSWLQFNPARREVYGLPLEEDVSQWVYYIRAVDSKGAYEQDSLAIRVQQHKLESVINHEFSLHIRIEKSQEFPHYIDWSLKVLRALGKIYGTNMSEITVRHINYTSEPVIFTWSNDTVPTNFCPKSTIEELYKTLTANDRGDPSKPLNTALAPELRVKKVLYREFGVCESPVTPETPRKNYPPFLRNPVDEVNATVGELLIYKVKDDTFYDPEDVDPTMLNVTLLTRDRQPIPQNNWLHFDSKNREFFGIPMKEGTTEYQLVCVDSGGLFAADSLVVVVSQPPKTPYNYEFSMIIEDNHDIFANSASKQRKLVEKLMELFEDPNPSNFRLLPFKRNDDLSLDSTVVTWYNKSLPTDICPVDEINRLESVIRYSGNNLRITSKVHNIMGPEFNVSTIKARPLGNCKKPHITTTTEASQVEETAPASSGDNYVFTFIIPAVIISIMLFLAALFACILYRRRRMGKMNVEEDGRQVYGNKGIPVIFQEELEEKPEPGTKTPVILKDEKPPLAPPEYSKSGSVKIDDSEPYQPPPPFTRTQDNGRQPRPKPTPTYRKPPPYVPP